MSLFQQPSAVSIGIGITVSFLDLLVMLHHLQGRAGADLWEALVPELLRQPSVVEAFEKCRLIEAHRDPAGDIVELVYRGSGSDITDIAEFLWRHKFGPKPAA